MKDEKRRSRSGDGILDHAQRIVDLVNAGIVRPGRRVGEASLASSLKVSRSAVRSALDYLEVAGVMERRPRSGTFLREFRVVEYCEIMDIRAALEGLGASNAALFAGKKQLQELKGQAIHVDVLNNRLIEGESVNLALLMELDMSFHLSLAGLGGNNRLVSILRQQRLIESTFFPAFQAIPAYVRKRWSVPSHREIVEAVALGDPDRAARVVRQHILRTKEFRVGIHTGVRD